MVAPLPATIEIFAAPPGGQRWGTSVWGAIGWATDAWQNVTPQGVTATIRWGIANPARGILATPDSDTWSLDLYDPARLLDPSNASAAYAGSLIAGLPVRISHRGVVIRTGIVESIGHSIARKTGYLRVTSVQAFLVRAMVPAGTTLPDTLYARAMAVRDVVALSMPVYGMPKGGVNDPVVAPMTLTSDTSAWAIITETALGNLQLPVIDRTGALRFRSWDNPLVAGVTLDATELVDVAAISADTDLYSIVTVLEANGTTSISRAITPPPNYGKRTYTRTIATLDADAWADAVLADRGQPGIRWVPGDVVPLTADRLEQLAAIQAVERVTINAAGVTADVLVVGATVKISAATPTTGRWAWAFECAQIEQPPGISGVASVNISATSVGISWQTRWPASSKVDYGTTAAYGSTTTLDTVGKTAHTVILTSLSASTLYHYRVRSIGADGVEQVTADATFTTVAASGDTTAPTISGHTVDTITTTSARVGWSLNEPATGQVEYGLTTGYGSLSVLETGYLPAHHQYLYSLTAGTLYHYRVRSRDAAGNLATSSDQTFTTTAASTGGGGAPANLQTAINAATAGSTINCTGATYTAPAGGFTINKTLTIIGGTINSPTSQRAMYITGTNVIIDGMTIRGVGNTQDYGAGIWARVANGLIVRNCTITDFNYVGIGILNTNGGTIEYNTIQRIAGLGPAVEDNAYGIFFSDDDNGVTYTRNMTAQYNTITDIPRWQGINTHNGRSLTWTGNITRRVRRAYWLAPTGSNRIVNCTVTGNFAYELDDNVGTGGSGYFVMNSDGCVFTGNYLSTTFSDASEPDAGEYVAKIRDYGSGSTTLTRNTTTTGA